MARPGQGKRKMKAVRKKRSTKQRRFEKQAGNWFAIAMMACWSFIVAICIWTAKIMWYILKACWLGIVWCFCKIISLFKKNRDNPE